MALNETELSRQLVNEREPILRNHLSDTVLPTSQLLTIGRVGALLLLNDRLWYPIHNFNDKKSDWLLVSEERLTLFQHII
jgi:hypothetical protein